MRMNKTGRIAARCGAGMLLSAIAGGAAAAENVSQRNIGQTGFDEIIVTARSPDADPTAIAPDAASLLATPGDVNDPLKALLSLPGVTFGGGDLDEPVVRGGGPRDNLYLVDGAPIDHAFHELSDSIISPNVVRTFDLHSAAFPPSYGDATGGVIDIGLRDPRADDAQLKIDLSQLKSGVLVEGPVAGGVSAYAAYRRNLAHLFLKEFERGNDALVFRMPESDDYAGRIIWRGDRTDVSFTALGSSDRTEERPRKSVPAASLLGETTTRRLDVQSLRIRSELGGRVDLNAVFSRSRANLDRRERNGSFAERDAEAYSLRVGLTRKAGSHALEAGANLTYAENKLSFRGFIPVCDAFQQRCGGAFSLTPASRELSTHAAEIYFRDNISISDRLMLDAGVHAFLDGYLDEFAIEPRMGATWRANERFDLYARAGIHHAAPEAERLLLLNALAEQQEYKRSRQALVGQRTELFGDWRLQTEVWFKDFDFVELAGSPLEQQIEGKAYGLDLIFSKPVGKRLSGWAAVSLSDGSFSDNGANPDVTNRYAPPVSITIAASYAFNSGWKIGAKYRTQSGDVYTPLEQVDIDPTSMTPRPVFGEPFSERLAAYSRLDFRIEKRANYGFAEITYYADVLNATDRRNSANRTYPLRNTLAMPDGTLTILPDDEDGIPFFVAFGVNLSF